MKPIELVEVCRVRKSAMSDVNVWAACVIYDDASMETVCCGTNHHSAKAANQCAVRLAKQHGVPVRLQRLW